MEDYFFYNIFPLIYENSSEYYAVGFSVKTALGIILTKSHVYRSRLHYHSWASGGSGKRPHNGRIILYLAVGIQDSAIGSLSLNLKLNLC